MRIPKRKGYQQEEKLLELIEKGEELQLKQDSFDLKRLQENGFITRLDNQLTLTEKGRHARLMGIKNYLECERIEREILRHSFEKSKKRGLILWTSFLLFLFLFLIFAAINFDLFFESGF